ncbi:MAG TPA: hypothetical protein VF819_10420 [Nitrospira sp.]
MNFLPSWLERLVSARARQRAVDLRIADKAKQLRRELSASFEDWPAGPNTLDELTTWAGKLGRGFAHTELHLRELVELRADASRHVQHAVGEARDHFYAAADIVNGLFKGSGLSIDDDNRREVDAKLRVAIRHVRDCLGALDAAQRKK